MKIIILALLLFASNVEAKVSYTGRSSSYTTKPRFSGHATKSSPGKPSYSGHAKTVHTGKSFSGHAVSHSEAKPGQSKFDSLGAREQMKVESRKQYSKGEAPKTEYKAGDRTIKIDPKDVKIQKLRNQLDHQKWVNRDLRQRQFYGAYYSRPVVVYHDPYPSLFWWWLLDRSLEERAMWAYCHRSDMDSARYQTLLAKDAQLEARIRQLEAQNVRRDAGYVPKGIDPDLMYSNEYVDAVYNPSHGSPPNNDSGWFVLKFLMWTLIIAFVVWMIWFVFIRVTE